VARPPGLQPSRSAADHACFHHRHRCLTDLRRSLIRPRDKADDFEARREGVGPVAEIKKALALRCAALADTSVSALRRLRTHFERLNEAYAGARFGRGCLLGNFSAELADQSQLIRERLADLYLSWSTDIATVIADAQADGSISTRTPAGYLAAFLLDTYEGALLRARVEKSGRAFDRFMTVAFTQILV
jgi:hypothetical protein